MGSTRIRGNRKPLLKIGAPGTDYATEITNYTIENEEAAADVVTFEDAANGGGRQFFLRGGAIQSTQTAAFWRWVWAHSGQENVPYTVAPHGNAAPTADQPHLVGTMKIGPKPKIGGEASTDANSAFVFDFEFKIDGEPTLDAGA